MTLEEMDEAIAALTKKNAEYDAANKISKALYHECEELERKVLSMMEAADKDVYIGAGFRVSKVHKMSVQTPKSPAEKKAFFAWLKEKQGEEVHDAYLSVNSQSLNSLYNDLTEEWAQRGEILMIDGLSEPIVRTSLSLRKA